MGHPATGGRCCADRFSAPALTPGLAAALWSAGVVLTGLAIAGLVLGDEDVPGYGVVFSLMGSAFVACGLIAWRRRPDSYSGLLMTATGFLLFVQPLFLPFASGETEVIAYVFGNLWSITIVWLLLTMLTGGRLVTRTDRVLVSAFVLEFFLTLGSVMFLEHDGNFLLVRADEGLSEDSKRRAR